MARMPDSDIGFSIHALRKMRQIVYTSTLINFFLRIFKPRGDCSFVVEEAEAQTFFGILRRPIRKQTRAKLKTPDQSDNFKDRIFDHLGDCQA
mgnify:CR=1 FL=1